MPEFKESDCCKNCNEYFSREECRLADSNLNRDYIYEDYDYYCICWFCTECLRDFYDNGKTECPSCDKDISRLLDAYEND